METPYKTLEEAQAAFPRTPLPGLDGHGTCLWHRQHEFYVQHVIPLLPTCSICGGALPPPNKGQHELCRLRQRSGRPTPRIDPEHTCYCRPCVLERKLRLRAR